MILGRIHLFVHCGPAIFVPQSEKIGPSPWVIVYRGYDVRIIAADVGRMRVDTRPHGKVSIEG